jgi:hypothetical protein
MAARTSGARTGAVAGLTSRTKFFEGITAGFFASAAKSPIVRSAIFTFPSTARLNSGESVMLDQVHIKLRSERGLEQPDNIGPTEFDVHPIAAS